MPGNLLWCVSVCVCLVCVCLCVCCVSTHMSELGVGRREKRVKDNNRKRSRTFGLLGRVLPPTPENQMQVSINSING